MRAALALAVGSLVAGNAQAQSDASSDLAKSLSNPVASLISVPLQYNYNQGFVDGDGVQQFVNVQPVIPISISPDWNLISRTIVPVISLDGVIPGETNSGLGGIVQSFFFSPKAPTASGLIWGAGPVISAPSITEGLGSDRWGLGATAVVLKQIGPATVGFLGNHVWSVTETDEFGESSVSFLQPFYTYTTPKATTFGVNTEATYDWNTDQWSVPINLSVSQLVVLDERPISLTAGIRYWAESPEFGPEDFGARLAITYLFPK